MAKVVGEFYKGRRKQRNTAVVIVGILLGILALVLVVFYGMQQYAVITKDDVQIKLKFLDDGEEAVQEDESGAYVFEDVTAEITYDEPDYSSVVPQAGYNVEPVRAIFVEYNNINDEMLPQYVNRLKEGNALVLEMMPKEGLLMWQTNSELGTKYGLSDYSGDIPSVMQDYMTYLKEENGIYLVAQINVCIDDLLNKSCTSVQLCNSVGYPYTDEIGSWLCPYNMDLRKFIVDCCNELYALGFDEVVLANVRQPAVDMNAEGAEPFLYTRTMMTTQNARYGVSSLVSYITSQLDKRSGLLSVYLDSSTALVNGFDNTNGQDLELFFKLFDRVYYMTDMYAYQFNVEYAQKYLDVGDVKDRFVPVVLNYLPDNTSWVLVDYEEKG